MRHAFSKLREIGRTCTHEQFIYARDWLRSHFTDNEWEQMWQTESWVETGILLANSVRTRSDSLTWAVFQKYCVSPPVTPPIDRTYVRRLMDRPLSPLAHSREASCPEVDNPLVIYPSRGTEREPPLHEGPRENRTMSSRLGEAAAMGFFDDDECNDSDE